MSSTRVSELEQQAAELSFDEQQELLARLARRVEMGAPEDAKPVSLYGHWAGRFPDDVDVEAVIREVRDAWKHRLDEAEL